MKKIAILNGKIFADMVKSLRDFRRKNVVCCKEEERITLIIDEGSSEIKCFATDGFTLGFYSAKCTQIDSAKYQKLYINVPPVLPSMTDFVLISSKSTEDRQTVLIEYQEAGFSFQTRSIITDDERHYEDYFQYTENASCIKIAFNPYYMKKAVESFIEGNSQIREGSKPIFMTLSGSLEPIRLYSENKKEQRLILPVRNKNVCEYMKNTRMKVLDDDTNLRCPACKKDLFFLRSKELEKEQITYCPYCGQAIDTKDI